MVEEFSHFHVPKLIVGHQDASLQIVGVVAAEEVGDVDDDVDVAVGCDAKGHKIQVVVEVVVLK